MRDNDEKIRHRLKYSENIEDFHTRQDHLSELRNQFREMVRFVLLYARRS